VFNRSVERRPVFTNKQEYERMRDLLWFYRYTKLPMKYSQFHPSGELGLHPFLNPSVARVFEKYTDLLLKWKIVGIWYPTPR
jgi:hypothetical protein